MRESELDHQIRRIDADIAKLESKRRALREERAVLVTADDRAEMKRRGHVTHTWAVTEKWATDLVCPFCLTNCVPSRQGKDFPNEQNAEYRCGNIGAIP